MPTRVDFAMGAEPRAGSAGSQGKDPNSNGFGKLAPMGHYDFYVNGGQLQPKCIAPNQCAIIDRYWVPKDSILSPIEASLRLFLCSPLYVGTSWDIEPPVYYGVALSAESDLTLKRIYITNIVISGKQVQRKMYFAMIRGPVEEERIYTGTNPVNRTAIVNYDPPLSQFNQEVSFIFQADGLTMKFQRF
ncbi:hypothetical protein QR680_011487 [Steinernema hermaphroditum]|uniref:Uncharacterized protein n=1 Tax=Steinernema hermaphroditum TaxID=289476 RepID=A0AA39LZ21_9BILA|nr:hypothetical protein QR680_011487 [Steinernema hermaphroditum]